VSVHPDGYRTGNTIYCAFIRMFGETKYEKSTANTELEERLAELDAARAAEVRDAHARRIEQRAQILDLVVGAVRRVGADDFQ
jgi:hypothetical protein